MPVPASTPGDPLTERQRRILEFMREHLARHGYAPTIREIGDHFGIRSPNGVLAHMRALRRKGVLCHAENFSRAWVPAAPPGACICCGRPLEDPS